MSKKDKLLDKVKNNSDNISIDDFCNLMKHKGWILDHQRGSHQIWYSPKSDRLSVQNWNGKAKGERLSSETIFNYIRRGGR